MSNDKGYGSGSTLLHTASVCHDYLSMLSNKMYPVSFDGSKPNGMRVGSFKRTSNGYTVVLETCQKDGDGLRIRVTGTKKVDVKDGQEITFRDNVVLF